MNENRTGLGYQNFEEIRTEHIFYIDKTRFIKDWWEYADKVTLITRPRRFGKTLNMSTIDCFFSNKYAGRSDLFEGLSIWKEENYRCLQGAYPVIFMSFASVKTGRTDGIKAAVKQIISNIYTNHRELMQSDIFDNTDKKYFQSVNDEMSDETALIAINRLCSYMERYYGKKAIVLLDEYDAPMQEAWIAGNWTEVVEFFRNFFNKTFKTNDSLYRGLITGITRISRESIFSDLNNLKVATTTSDKYETCFGFTEEEVFETLDYIGLEAEKNGVKEWYDGFTFGKYKDIYNPWSIASFIENGGKYEAYWTDTSSNELVNSLVQRGTPDIKQTMEKLIQGKSFETELDEQIVLNHLDNNTNAVWSLLLATGYLKVEKLEYTGRHKKKIYTLSLTNMEVEIMFENMVKGWFGGSTETAYNNFVRALLINDIDAMNEYMNKIALHSFSSFDIAKSTSDDDAPERFYHGFVLGLIVELEGRFVITSNRESGFGRYDVMLTPIDRRKDNAYIIEFKVYKPAKEKNLQETLTNALLQIEEKQYETQLLSNGFSPEQIKKYGFVFQGKECLIG